MRRTWQSTIFFRGRVGGGGSGGDGILDSTLGSCMILLTLLASVLAEFASAVCIGYGFVIKKKGSYVNMLE